MSKTGDVAELLRRRIGLDPETAGPALIERAIRDRMRALTIAENERGRYLQILSENPEETDALVEEIVIAESWFFRDDAPFQFLATLAERWRSRLVSNKPPLRILSVPCARGEEPYSIAMLLLDRGFPPAAFRIDAVDVSSRSLEYARRGIYSSHAFRSSDLAFRDKYFEHRANGQALKPEVKSAVHFHRGNVLDAKLLADQPPFDVVFCRNLLIYLDRSSRSRAIENLGRLLDVAGTLFVGHAEPASLLGGLFRHTDDPRFFAFRRAGATNGPPPRQAGSKKAPAKPVRPPKPPPIRPPEVRAVVEADRGITAPEIKNASDLADQGKHAEASKICEEVLSRKGPSTDAFFLMGVIRQSVGDRGQAELYFQKTVYLDPKHEQALLSLSMLAQRRGDRDAAANYRLRAERAARERQA